MEIKVLVAHLPFAVKGRSDEVLFVCVLHTVQALRAGMRDGRMRGEKTKGGKRCAE
jgi:hypothetical protein